MNYDITFKRAHERETFRIYNATDIIDAIQRFQKANPGCIVVKAEEVILQ